MLKRNIKSYRKLEQRALREAFHPEHSVRRTRGIVLSAAVVILGVVLFALFGVGPLFFAGLTAATVIVSAMEKLTYQRSMRSYESLVRKLVHRVEELEGVPLTPVGREESEPGVFVTTKPREVNDPHASSEHRIN